MAKKKKTSSSRTTKTHSKKKVARKKTTQKKSPQKKTAKARSTGSGGKSVDGVLQKYEQERSAQESLLATLRKKIEELEAKTRVYQEQITKLTDQADATRDAIEQLDSRRDEEVGKLLSKLGVQLGGDSSVSVANQPASDEDDQPAADTESNGDDLADDANSDLDEDADAGSADESDAESEAET